METREMEQLHGMEWDRCLTRKMALGRHAAKWQAALVVISTFFSMFLMSSSAFVGYGIGVWILDPCFIWRSACIASRFYRRAPTG
jgi:antibiotic biosynthesis monooxygenase (ABM) superfamily enzyme